MVKPHVPLFANRQPLIARFYYRFLDDGNVADFVRSVATAYTAATLHRLATDGERSTRRGAVLALTYVGRSESIPAVGQALRDEDRAVRVIAEDGLPGMWQRVGTFEQAQQLQLIMRYNAVGQYDEALRIADSILDRHGEFAEVWHQRAEAMAAQGQFYEAIADQQRALESEPYHFLASLGMAQCYLELGELPAAISCLQWTLQIHPTLDYARAQIRRLERDLREQTDR